MNKYILTGIAAIICLLGFRNPEKERKVGKALFAQFIVPDQKDTLKPKSKKIFMKGTIKDKKGEPLIGAVIYIEKLTTGAIANEYGNYILEIPDSISNCKIKVSYIGFFPKYFQFQRLDSFKIKK